MTLLQDLRKAAKAGYVDKELQQELMSISQLHDVVATPPKDDFSMSSSIIGKQRDIISDIRNQLAANDKAAAEQRRLAFANEIKPRVAELVPLESIKFCSNCSKEFTNAWFKSVQKHNCNLCGSPIWTISFSMILTLYLVLLGRVFCADCAGTTVALPPTVSSPQTSEGGGILSASFRGMFSFGTQTPTQVSRVCKLCLSERAGDPFSVWVISSALFALSVDPITLHAVKYICNSYALHNWAPSALLITLVGLGGELLLPNV